MNAEILNVTFNDLDELVSLNEEVMFFGRGVRPHFEKVLRNPDNIALKCVVDGVFAGALVYVKGVELLGGDDYAELFRQIERLLEGRAVYTGDTVAVKREYRRHGLAGRLCAAMIAELRRRGAQMALNEFWVYPDGSIPALNAFGAFDKSIFLGRFYKFYRELHHLGFACPVCKNECICAADIYLAEIPEVRKEVRDENFQDRR